MIAAPQGVGVGVIEISTGGFYSTALTIEGHLYTLGGGDKGQLGHGDASQMCLLLWRGKRVALRSAGMHHTLAVGLWRVQTLGHNGEPMQTICLLVELLVGKGAKEISSTIGGFHSLTLPSGGGEGHMGALYQPKKGEQHIRFATADGGDDEDDGEDRPKKKRRWHN